jgi:serine/threonine protein kinase/tetratricopeptide (TPR) repeat protein
MHSTAKKPAWLELEGFVDAFEEAHVRNGQADLADFLPPLEHPHRRDVVLELVRVDLEYRWQRGDSCSSESYRATFPELFDDPRAAGQVEFEIERLRRRRLDEQAFPEVGDDFLGFHLVGELGHGAFGKVFLAEQEGLANRSVALKVSKILFAESQTLAQLQHTNIVPIYSVHVRRPFQAVCMPYFGGTTLADVLKLLRGNTTPPASGLDLLSTVRNPATVDLRVTSIVDERAAAAANGKPAANGATAIGSASGGTTRGTFASLETIAIDAKPHEQQADGLAERNGVPWARLAGLSYVEAVLCIVARLADGLDHAHTRGVVHRDLKPANILLADDGQPMLLDFNLSVNAAADQSDQTARVGGTLQYMSPEQVAALDGRAATVDSRSDIYSLGVVLYELLSLRQPFSSPAGIEPKSLALIQTERRQECPSLRALNPAVSPAVESIVRHALEADSSRRYRSARELKEDIELHLGHRPLRYAPEPSWRERTAKWVRRHPRLTSNGSVALIGVVSLLLAVGAWFAVEQRQARFAALEKFREFETSLPPVLFRLNGALSTDRPRREEMVEQGRQLLALYHLADDAHWHNRPAVANLDDVLQRGLRDRLGGLSLSIAAAMVDVEADSGMFENALEWNQLADRCFLPDERPRVLWTQRAELLRRLGRDEEAAAAAANAKEAPSQRAIDHYWEGFERAQRHEYQEAISALEAATEEDPRLFWGWFQLGRCNDALARNGRAAECYTVCLALLPDSGDAYYHRGLARLRDGLYSHALADFDQVVRFLPNLASVYLDRGEARLGLNDPTGAATEFTRALKMGADEARGLLGRSKARGLSGDVAGAQRDRAAGLAAQPTREDGWVARGMAKLPGDSTGALADYAEALKLAPRYLPALQNSAAVLGELPGRGEEAIKLLDRVLEACPDFVPARIGRAVLMARAGRRDAALADARKSLLRDQQPVTLYQAACAFALVSQGRADDRREALRLLATALAQGFGQEFVATDRDLDPLRGDDEFRRIVAQASSPASETTAPP